MCSDYLNFLLLKDNEKEAIYAMLTFIEQNNHLWSVLRLTDIPSNSITLPLMQSFFQKNGIIIKKHTACHYINLSSTWDEIYNAYSSKVRNTIERKMKKLKTIGQLDFFEVTSNGDLETYFLELVRLNKLRMENKEYPITFFG